MAKSPTILFDPSDSSRNSLKQGERKALALFYEASTKVPAYKDFLKKEKVKPELIRTYADFKKVPLTDKTNYIQKYSLAQMSWGGTLENARYISTSSGSTGTPFFWPRGREQDALAGEMFRHVYQGIFDSKKGSTLFVDSFALGTWIAGLEFYNATKVVADAGSNVVIVTPGIDKAETINQVLKLAPQFDRVVLAGYPPFLKDIIEHGSLSGIDWDTIDVRLFFAGESVSEYWRDRVISLLGKNDAATRAVNVYGMAEAGAVAHETPVSIFLRTIMRQVPVHPSSEFPEPDTVLGLYQYYPTVRHFEVVDQSSLVLTTRAGLPLIRYDTRDSGGILPYDHVIKMYGKQLTKTAKQSKINIQRWQLPFVFLHGRKDLSVSLYALNIYVENVKHALENSKLASNLSGLFIMGVEHTDTLDQQFTIIVELARGKEPSASLRDALTYEAVASLRKLNTEYAKLHSVVGERAIPNISLVRYGEIQTVPGRKHKWVKR